MSRFRGVIPAVVESLDDSDGMGRICVRFPHLPGENRSFPASVAAPMAGKNRGFFFHPEVGDEVLVAFNEGDPQHPYIVGFLWNGNDLPPTTDHHRRLFRSVNGHEVEIYDPDVAAGDKGYIRLKDAHGNVVELANARLTITGIGMLEIKAPMVTINGRTVAPVPSPI
jgi:uncharacterized protein involved in type VI secretion and phage assembly